MTDLNAAGTFPLGDRTVRRMGYGAMQLAGPHVFGPPKDRAAAIAVLREAVAAGVDHIDTSDFYGPHVTNRIIREALHPYPDDLTIVTKVGAVRGADGSWNPAQSPAELAAAVDDNRRNLDRDRIDVVNLRIVTASQAPEEGSIAERVEALAGLQAKGVIGHIGLSTVTAAQVAEARGIVPVVCVQNLYNTRRCRCRAPATPATTSSRRRSMSSPPPGYSIPRRSPCTAIFRRVARRSSRRGSTRSSRR